MTAQSKASCTAALVKAGFSIWAKALGKGIAGLVSAFKFRDACKVIKDCLVSVALFVAFFLGLMVSGLLFAELIYLLGLLWVLITDDAIKFSLASLSPLTADVTVRTMAMLTGLGIVTGLVVLLILATLASAVLGHFCELGAKSQRSNEAGS